MDKQQVTTSDRLGEVVREGGRVALRYERRLAHPPAKVWQSITESENLRHWFPADIVGERRAGARVSMPFWPESVIHGEVEIAAAGIDIDDPRLPGEIRSWEPPRLFELVWGEPEGNGELLRFELRPDGDGTLLTFTTWVGEPGPSGHAGTAAGYHVCLDALEQLLDTGAAGSPASVDTAALQARYETVIDL